MFMGLVTSTLNLIQMMSWELSDTMNKIAQNLEYCKDLTAFCALSETPGALDLPGAGIPFESLEFRQPLPPGEVHALFLYFAQRGLFFDRAVDAAGGRVGIGQAFLASRAIFLWMAMDRWAPTLPSTTSGRKLPTPLST